MRKVTALRTLNRKATLTNSPVPSVDNITTKTKLNSSEQSTLIREMEQWFDVGAAILGVRRTKVPCKGIPWRNRSDGIGYTEEELFTRILHNDASGIALICGPTSGIVGIGCDTMEGGELLRSVLRNGGINAISYKSGKGIHFLFKNTSSLPHTCAKILPTYGEVDIRSADRGYLILPGSLHPSGALYEWLDPPRFNHEGKLYLPDVPSWLLTEIYNGKHKKKIYKNEDGDYDGDHHWCKEHECNDHPSLDPTEALPPRIRKGFFMKLFRFTLPKQRWEKFTKHPAAVDWIIPGEPIREGERYYAERAIGGLVATCYANTTVAIRLLETFRYVYIPTRRDREEEMEINRYVERLCREAQDSQSNRDYKHEPPDPKKDPEGYDRFWYNVDRRNGYLESLVVEFHEKKICHKLYGEALSAEDYVRFLLLTFRSRLIYVSVWGNSKLRTIYDSLLLQEGTSSSYYTPSSPSASSNREYATYKKHQELFGSGAYEKPTASIRDLALRTTSKKKSRREKILARQATELHKAQRERKRRSTRPPKFHSSPPGMHLDPGSVEKASKRHLDMILVGQGELTSSGEGNVVGQSQVTLLGAESKVTGL